MLEQQTTHFNHVLVRAIEAESLQAYVSDVSLGLDYDGVSYILKQARVPV